MAFFELSVICGTACAVAAKFLRAHLANRVTASPPVARELSCCGSRCDSIARSACRLLSRRHAEGLVTTADRLVTSVGGRLGVQPALRSAITGPTRTATCMAGRADPDQNTASGLIGTPVAPSIGIAAMTS